MTEKIDNSTKAELVITTTSAVRRITGFFKHGLAERLSPENLGRLANAWADRTYNGKIRAEKRNGYVLRTVEPLAQQSACARLLAADCVLMMCPQASRISTVCSTS